MPKVIQVPNLGPVEFPDSMTDDQITSAIRAQAGGTPSTEPKSVGGFIENLATSTANLPQQVFSAVTHPVETVKALGSIPLGVYQKMGGPLPPPGPGEVDAAAQLDAMVNHLKNRYGSLDRAKETLYQDPVGFGTDVATAFTGAGGALKGAATVADLLNATGLSRVLGTTGKVAGTIGRFTDPLNLPLEITGRIAQGTVPVLNRSALRGGYTVNTPFDELQRAVTGMGEQNIPFSQRGVEKAREVVADLQQQKVDLLNKAAAAGQTVPRQSVIDALTHLRARTAQQINPAADLRQIDKIIADVTQRLPDQIPVDVAERLKEGTFSVTKWGKGAPPQFQATAEAEKAAALRLKDELVTQIPELGELNSAQQRQINLEGILEKAVNKYRVAGGFGGRAVQQLTGKGLQLGGGAGTLAGIATHDPVLGAFAGISADVLHTILSDPKVKSTLAIAINRAQQLNPARWGVPRMATAVSRVEEYRRSLQPDGQSVQAAPE